MLALDRSPELLDKVVILNRIRRALHSVKDNAGAMGCQPIEEAANAVEQGIDRWLNRGSTRQGDTQVYLECMQASDGQRWHVCGRDGCGSI